MIKVTKRNNENVQFHSKVHNSLKKHVSAVGFEAANSKKAQNGVVA